MSLTRCSKSARRIRARPLTPFAKSCTFWPRCTATIVSQKMKCDFSLFVGRCVYVRSQIVYPALDAKVKNVTLPYRVEHADEGQLFIQLMQLLVTFTSTASLSHRSIPPPRRNDDVTGRGLCRELACKVEEVRTTIRKHLDKEEQILFPLLLKHFTYTEQAMMIAEFLFCIPMTMVGRFLNWIQPSLVTEERLELVEHMRGAVSDRLLLALLTTWLDPSHHGSVSEGSDREAVIEVPERPPLRTIANIHRSIDLSLQSFIQEARDLVRQPDIDGDHIVSLLEKHRFLKDVCRFHMLSEEEIVFPVASSYLDIGSCHLEHLDEGALFDDLGRLLTDVRSTARRGSVKSKELLDEVITCAEAMRENLGSHMLREEQEIIPLLQEKLGSVEQCLIVWQMLTMMPLRLLERVMPWMSSATRVVGHTRVRCLM